MNTVGINLGSLNGGPAVKWVISASAIAFAGVTSSADAIRVCSGNVYGNAVATVTLTGSNTVAARATGVCESNSGVIPTIQRNSSSYALGEAFGNASVWRNIAGHAYADGTAYGECIASDYLGESNTDAISDGVGTAQIIFSGKINVVAEATGTADSIAIRGTTVLGLAGSSGFGEPSIQRSGESFTRLYSFINAVAESTGFVRNDYTATIATVGSFVVSDSVGIGRAYMIHPGRVNIWSTANADSFALRTTYATSEATATATGTAGDTRIKFGHSFGIGTFDTFQAKANVRYQARGTATSEAYSLVSAAKINHSGKSTGNAEATSNAPVHATHRFAFTNANAKASYSIGVPLITRGGKATNTADSYGTSVYAAHHFGVASAVSNATGLVTKTNINYAAKAIAVGTAGGTSQYANQYWGAGTNNATASSSVAKADTNFAGKAFNACLANGTSEYAEHHFGSATAQTISDGLSTPTLIYIGNVLATATVTTDVIGFSNADVHAPESRSMIAPYEGRGMIAPEENRTMVVEA